MYNGSSGEGLSLRDIQYVHWDCRTGGAAGEQAAPGQRWCKREVRSCSSEIGIYSCTHGECRQPQQRSLVEQRETDESRGVEGTDERELNTSWDMKIWKEQRKVVKY